MIWVGQFFIKYAHFVPMIQTFRLKKKSAPQLLNSLHICCSCEDLRAQPVDPPRQPIRAHYLDRVLISFLFWIHVQPQKAGNRCHKSVITSSLLCFVLQESIHSWSRRTWTMPSSPPQVCHIVCSRHTLLGMPKGLGHFTKTFGHILRTNLQALKNTENSRTFDSTYWVAASA